MTQLPFILYNTHTQQHSLAGEIIISSPSYKNSTSIQRCKVSLLRIFDS